MTEEQVTKAILQWLDGAKWQILAYDFPQSGTGIVFHPNEDMGASTKNRGSFIPDVIAAREGVCLFFENKDRFVLEDFVKVSQLIRNKKYSKSIDDYLLQYKIGQIYYGVGLPFAESYLGKVKSNAHLVDFIVFLGPDKTRRLFKMPKDILSILPR